MKSFDWSDFCLHCCSETDSNGLYNEFMAIFQKMYNVTFPERTVKKTKAQLCTPPWISKRLVKCCKKSKLLVKFKKIGSSLDKNKFTVYRNNLKKILVAAEKMYYAVHRKCCEFKKDVASNKWNFGQRELQIFYI